MMVDKATGFKRSAFFETKDGIIEYICQTMHFMALQGYPIQDLRQDNAEENVNSLTAKSVLAGEKLVGMYSIST